MIFFRRSALQNCSTDTPLFIFKDKVVEAKIVYVYDGDTVHACFFLENNLRRFKLRLYGINTPELRPPRDKEDREDEIERAKKARDFLKKLIDNSIVWLHLDDFDKYITIK